MEKIILDTNILIEILKNNQTTIDKVEQYSEHYISSITKMELYYGAFNKQETQKIKRFLELFKVIELNETISEIATNLIYKYAKSHNLDIPDSLIAATSLYANIELFTYNTKDFKFIDNINLSTQS